jgi:hypothetical protein
MKNYLILLLITSAFCAQTFAGLPPTTAKDSADAGAPTTFNFKFPNFTGTHTGTNFSLGNIIGGAIDNAPIGGTTPSSANFTGVTIGTGTLNSVNDSPLKIFSASDTYNQQWIGPGAGGYQQWDWVVSPSNLLLKNDALYTYTVDFDNTGAVSFGNLLQDIGSTEVYGLANKKALTIANSATNPGNLITAYASDFSTVLSVMDNAGHLGMGTATPNGYIDIEGTQTGTSSFYAIRDSMLIRPTANASATFIGLSAAPKQISNFNVSTVKGVSSQPQQQGNASSTVTTLNALDAETFTNNGGNTGTAYGAYFNNSSLSTGTIGTAYGIYIDGGYDAYGNTIGNWYGLYLNTPAVGTGNRYSLYNPGGNVYFGGQVGIANSSPSYPLDVTGTARATTFIGPLTGNASTATALAATPTGCSAGQYATAIAANGNLTCSVVPTPTPGPAGGVTSFNTRVGAVTLSGTDVGSLILATPTPHEWIDSISSSGVPHLSQPAYADLSGTPTPAPTATPVPQFTTTTAGIVPASGTTPGAVLHQDGTWSVVPTPTPGGAGSVTSVSVVSANGLAGTVATSTTTPAITLSTSVTGMMLGNGTGITAATSGTDFSAGTSGNTTGIVKSTTGTGALTTAVAADFPTLNQSTTGNAATVTTNANLTGDVTSVGNATTYGNIVPATKGGTGGDSSAQTGIARDTAGTWSYGTINLSTDTAGTPLPLVKGGTGVAAASSLIAFNALSQMSGIGDLISQNGSGAIRVPAGTTGNVLQTNSTGGIPSWVLPSVSSQAFNEGSASSITTLQVPNNQFTTTAAGSRLIETGNANVLLNPSFEASTYSTNWTITNSTGAVETSAIPLGAGLKASKHTLSAQTGDLLVQSVTPTVGYTLGQNLEAACRVNTTLTTIQVCGLSGGTEQACQTVAGNGNYVLVSANFPGPANGTSVGVKVKSTSSSTGVVYVDDCYVGQARNLGQVSVDTDWASFTPTGATSTSTTYTGDWRRNGDSMEVRFIIAFSGTLSGTAFTLNLPTGYVIDTTKLPGTTAAVSNIQNGNHVVYASGIYPLTINYNTTTSVIFRDSVTFSGNLSSAATGDAIGGFFKVPIVGWTSAASSTATQNQTLLPTIQKFTSGSGTYTKPAGVSYITVKMVGGGGGGSGGGSATGTSAGAGGNTTFGTGTAGGGGAGGYQSVGGAPGTCTNGAGWLGNATGFPGSGGQGGSLEQGSVGQASGGSGGASAFGGGGAGGNYNNTGSAGGTNTGGGGGAGGSGAAATTIGGSGGGAGCAIVAIIPNSALASTFSYSVAAAGTAGGPGASGNAGAAGGSGYIEITEYYQQQNANLIIGGVTSRANTFGVLTIDTTATVTASTYSATDQVDAIMANTASNAITITLPSAATYIGKTYKLVQTSNTNLASWTSSSGTICGQTTIKTSGANDGLTVQSDGTNWVGLDGGCTRNDRVKVTATCSGGTCTSTGSTGISSITWGSTGNYTMNFPAGIFSSSPVCTFSCGGTISNCLIVLLNSETTTTFPFRAQQSNTPGTTQDVGSMTAQCQGPR